jgi:putative hydrolase of the HAD superfamily
MESKKLIIFFDCGDTIIDEGTEIKDNKGVVIKADIIPGADTMIKSLYEKGYTLAVVADGYTQSFKNTLSQNGLYNYFSALIYSEDVGVSKPDPRMFYAAISALGLSENDCSRIVMVGNNLSRDIKGANKLEIISVLLSWTPRYPKVPADDIEKPDFIINHPLELLELVDRLNLEIC